MSCTFRIDERAQRHKEQLVCLVVKICRKGDTMKLAKCMSVLGVAAAMLLGSVVSTTAPASAQTTTMSHGTEMHGTKAHHRTMAAHHRKMMRHHASKMRYHRARGEMRTARRHERMMKHHRKMMRHHTSMMRR